MLYSPITQSQWWVQTNVWNHYFTTFSGIKDTASTSQYADGQSARIYNLKGPRSLQQVTVSTPFDPVLHADIVDKWKAHRCEFLTILVNPVTCGEDPEIIGGRTLLIPDAQMISLSFANVDRSSSNVSMLELGFIINTFTYS